MQTYNRNQTLSRDNLSGDAKMRGKMLINRKKKN